MSSIFKIVIDFVWKYFSSITRHKCQRSYLAPNVSNQDKHGNMSDKIQESHDKEDNVSLKKRKMNSQGREKSDEITETNNRKFAQATRTPKACDLCRKQKTRCFKSVNDEVSCSRCIFLNKECSFSQRQDISQSPSIPDNEILKDERTKTKLDLIHAGINELLSIIKSDNGKVNIRSSDAELLLTAGQAFNGIPGSSSSTSSKKSKPNTPTNMTSNVSSEIESLVDTDSGPLFNYSINSFKMAPFAMVCNQVETSHIPKSILNLLNLSTVESSLDQTLLYKSNKDIISLGLLTEAEAVDLMNKFRRNHGRWVSFPSNAPTDVLVERIRNKSPLLLTTCCCLSLRYSFKGANSSHLEILNKKKSNYRLLMKQLAEELNDSLSKYTSFPKSTLNNGDIEFLQALVLLSIYSLSLSSIASSRLSLDLSDDSVLHELNLDAWYLSSIGLTTFVSKATFGTLLQKTKNTGNVDLPFTIFYDEIDSEEYQTLTTLRIFNHLTLVHLINCIFSGRMCVVDEIRLNYCTATLTLPSSTNFDGRMVSEISILLITYNYIQLNLNDITATTLEECEMNYSTTTGNMNAWYNQWEYIFNQPTLQFVELCYHFCGLIVIYAYNFRRSTLIDANPPIFDIFDDNNVDYVLRHCNSRSLREMITHACQLLKFVNVVDSDSYFAYLSDQIHFCFYFTTIILIKILSFIRSQKLQMVSDMCNLDSVLKDINLLLGKFHTIQQDDDDIVTKYELGIRYALHKSFVE
ncbi:DEHA2F13222p [Debaryomyces hansenii CBS767]|uniref:DEHA2F13222p n=1 Tax=Debaryomyces hansenii (strain ATCC 36239 / CBS 767 / BCRC 21394 / JCM 1990 / NBRC 0083 / IGC 2968) TaxID=284592 RepID=B5RUF9_DEBHA|nr:DEHA2F13222p [Debaryomyces hansenii CBS767]CAR66337.1 DEHA2F13222p [Debaryomyces hansenii CBS767]|eukprot:XP_002770813.1 DEHA2F13222p [Debaryomyces hansenii CBS767]